jgi:hypothetical protein
MADYAISNVPRRVVYAPSGVGPYAFTFEILNQTDIAVYKASTLLTLTTDYTVIINANGTGSVTLVATAGTSNITIVGAKNIQRTTDFTTGGDLFANTLNDELDNQTIFIQQVAETAERGLKAPVVDPTDINMTLPAKASRVGTVLAFNATTGNPEAGPSIGSVTTVAAQSANINTVASNIASVNTVAGNIANVNTVAGISADVTMVATFQFNVNTVADDLNEPTSEINTVAVDIANVNAVGTNISNVNTVSGISANVTTVAGISGNVTTVAGVAAGVTTVAGISSNVTTVAGVAANVTTVAGISSNVTTVATNNANVTTVAGSIANVNNVGGNIANVNQVAADTAVINSASANAATATTKAAEALASANSASASAAAASAVALGSEPVRHSIRPSLLLDFANTKTLDPRITFTRASTASFYDGKTVAKAEENLLLNSQGIGTAVWFNIGTVSANSATAPDGTTTATTFTATAATGTFGSYQNFTYLASTYTLSVYLKAGTYNFATVDLGNSGSPATAFNLSTGAVIANAGGATSTITSVGSGWYRCTVTATMTAGANFPEIYLNGSASVIQRTWTAAGTESILAWGAQLEQRSAVTAYQVTTTAAITNYIPALQTAASGVPRFEHNPTTGESLGLEIEEQRTNLLTYSSDYSNAIWTKNNLTIDTAANIAPDGTQTAQKLVTNTTNAEHRIIQSFTTSAANNTMTVYAKAAGYNWIILQGHGYAWFDVANGTVGNQVLCTGTITAVGNGWYRCSIVMTSTSNIMTVWVANANNTTSFAGNGFSGAFIWGAQVESGAFASSYIPTVGSTATRSADAGAMTGTNFSSWFSYGKGTYYVEGTTQLSSGVVPNFLNDEAISIGITGGTGVVRVSASPTQGFLAGYTAITYPTTQKIAVKFQSGASNSAISVSGGGASAFTYPQGTPLNLGIGAIFTGFGFGARGINGFIKKIAFYPVALTNAELQGLTTV